MGSLSTRVDRLERGGDRLGSPGPPDAWYAVFNDHLRTVLLSMPEARALAALATIRAMEWPGDAIARRAVDLALSASPPAAPHWFPPEWRGWICCPPPEQGPLALPEAVCRVLEEHPEANFSYYSCASCGYYSGEAWWRRRADVCAAEHGHDRPALGRALFSHCPLCGDVVDIGAYDLRRQYERAAQIAAGSQAWAG